MLCVSLFIIRTHVLIIMLYVDMSTHNVSIYVHVYYIYIILRVLYANMITYVLNRTVNASCTVVLLLRLYNDIYTHRTHIHGYVCCLFIHIISELMYNVTYCVCYELMYNVTYVVRCNVHVPNSVVMLRMLYRHHVTYFVCRYAYASNIYIMLRMLYAYMYKFRIDK